MKDPKTIGLVFIEKFADWNSASLQPPRSNGSARALWRYALGQVRSFHGWLPSRGRVRACAARE